MGQLELDDYKTAMLIEFSTAWENTQVSVRDAQTRYKNQYNRSAKHQFHVAIGDRVFVVEKGIRGRKLSRPFQGPYRIVKVGDNNVEVRPVGRPSDPPERLNIEQVRPRPREIPVSSTCQ